MSEQSSFILPGTTDFLNPEQVNKIHSYADVDTGVRALHHTLGRGAFQAAPGTHEHYKTGWSPWLKYTNFSPHTSLSDYGGSWGTGIYGRYSFDKSQIQFTGMCKVITASVPFNQWVMTCPADWPRPKCNKMWAGQCSRYNSGTPVEDYCRIDLSTSGAINVLPAQGDSIPVGAWFGFGGLATFDLTIGN